MMSCTLWPGGHAEKEVLCPRIVSRPHKVNDGYRLHKGIHTRVGLQSSLHKGVHTGVGLWSSFHKGIHTRVSL
jgi:hypothetical protein